MSPKARPMRKFKIEGSAAELRCLMETIQEALQRVPKASGEVVVRGSLGPLDIQVTLKTPNTPLAVRPDSRAEGAMLLEGWAENVKCANCEIPVALLFEEEYFEASSGAGALCGNCMQEELDGEASEI
jgi:hypothetical protein